jgi:transposase
MPYQVTTATATRRLSDQLITAHERPVIVHPRMAWILYYEQKKNVRAVCQKFGISRKTFYKWLKRYRASGGDPASLVDNSRRPHRSPRATPKDVINRIIEAKRETGYGQRKLKQYLEEHHSISISEHTIWKLLKRLYSEEEYSVGGEVSQAEPRPGEVVQIAVKDLTSHINSSAYVQYTALDICSRLRISKIYRRHSWRSAADFVKFVIEKIPFPIKEIQTPSDGPFTNEGNGSEISAILFEPVSVLLQKNNIAHTLLTPAQLRQSFVERVHEADDEEFFKRNSYRKPEELIRAAAEFVSLYNNHRKNSDLNGLTPLQKLRTYTEFKNVVYFDPYS